MARVIPFPVSTEPVTDVYVTPEQTPEEQRTDLDAFTKAVCQQLVTRYQRYPAWDDRCNTQMITVIQSLLMLSRQLTPLPPRETHEKV